MLATANLYILDVPRECACIFESYALYFCCQIIGESIVRVAAQATGADTLYFRPVAIDICFNFHIAGAPELHFRIESQLCGGVDVCPRGFSLCAVPRNFKLIGVIDDVTSALYGCDGDGDGSLCGEVFVVFGLGDGPCSRAVVVGCCDGLLLRVVDSDVFTCGLGNGDRAVFGVGVVGCAGNGYGFVVREGLAVGVLACE